MNQTLRELRTIADRERARFLPEVTAQNLEKSGALFYMNGQNGTEFDWYVNDRLSSFMVFYNDEANLGAVKLYLNRSATADVFLYSGPYRHRASRQQASESPFCTACWSS